MDKTHKPESPIELKSPAVQEILGRPPRWIIRWGKRIKKNATCYCIDIKTIESFFCI